MRILLHPHAPTRVGTQVHLPLPLSIMLFATFATSSACLFLHTTIPSPPVHSCPSSVHHSWASAPVALPPCTCQVILRPRPVQLTPFQHQADFILGPHVQHCMCPFVHPTCSVLIRGSATLPFSYKIPRSCRVLCRPLSPLGRCSICRKPSWSPCCTSVCCACPPVQHQTLF